MVCAVALGERMPAAGADLDVGVHGCPSVFDCNLDQLLTSPARGNSFEGFIIQQIVALEELQRSGSGFYFFRTHAGAEIDLLIDRGRQRIGFEFKAGVATEAADWKHLQAGIDDGVIHRGCAVYNGARDFAVSEKISVIPATQILSGRLDL